MLRYEYNIVYGEWMILKPDNTVYAWVKTELDAQFITDAYNDALC